MLFKDKNHNNKNGNILVYKVTELKHLTCSKSFRLKHEAEKIKLTILLKIYLDF